MAASFRRIENTLPNIRRLSVTRGDAPRLSELRRHSCTAPRLRKPVCPSVHLRHQVDATSARNSQLYCIETSMTLQLIIQVFAANSVHNGAVMHHPRLRIRAPWRSLPWSSRAHRPRSGSSRNRSTGCSLRKWRRSSPARQSSPRPNARRRHPVTSGDSRAEWRHALRRLEDDRRKAQRRHHAGTGSEIGFQDSWRTEIPAYELDKLIGLKMVPVSVSAPIKAGRGPSSPGSLSACRKPNG